MNKKAELFQKYLKSNNIEAFTIDEIENDELNTVVFRSNVEIQGNNLPTIVILDSSIYGTIRILISPRVLNETNELALLQLINSYNKKYKSLKYYLDNQGDLVMDISLIFKPNQLESELIYTMFNVVIEHLNESYKEIMKTIWN